MAISTKDIDGTMKKITFLLVVGALFLGNSSHLRAQIQNGSFATGDLSGWTTVGGSSGGPDVLTGLPTSNLPAPPMGSTAALVQSENGDTGATTASAAALDSALGVTLPPTVGDALSGYPGTHLPVNGQAIYQTFRLSSAATLSFAYSFQSFDSIPFDSTGYVLNGVYNQLASPTEPYYVLPNPTPTAYTTLSFALNPGTYTLGFVAYNTGDNTLSSSLFVTDISVPEPSAWKLIVLACAGLLIVSRLRSKLSVG